MSDLGCIIGSPRSVGLVLLVFGEWGTLHARMLLHNDAAGMDAGVGRLVAVLLRVRLFNTPYRTKPTSINDATATASIAKAAADVNAGADACCLLV